MNSMVSTASEILIPPQKLFGKEIDKEISFTPDVHFRYLDAYQSQLIEY